MVANILANLAAVTLTAYSAFCSCFCIHIGDRVPRNQHLPTSFGEFGKSLRWNGLYPIMLSHKAHPNCSMAVFCAAKNVLALQSGRLPYGR